MVAILAYIAVRPAVNGPLFVFKDGSFLTRDRLVSAIRRALSSAGIETTGFSGHSFRVGAATTAAVVGVEDSTIKMLGRWESSAYQRYLRTPRETLAAISTRLVTQCVFHHIGFQNQKYVFGRGCSATLGLCMFGLDGCGCEKQRQPQKYDYDIPQRC